MSKSVFLLNELCVLATAPLSLKIPSLRERWRRSRWAWSTSLYGYIRNTPSDTEVHAEHQLRAYRST